jgi:hypothetical protein
MVIFPGKDPDDVGISMALNNIVYALGLDDLGPWSEPEHRTDPFPTNEESGPGGRLLA